MTNLHSAATIIMIISFRVAVIKAAATIVILTAHDCVHGFWIIASGDACGLVYMVAKLRIDQELRDRTGGET